MSYGFLNGTKVETGFGAYPVERVRPGDRVLTLAGKLERVAWVGQTTLSAKEVARAPGLKPVRLRTSALWPSSPSHDLITAPEQGVLLCSGAGQAASRMMAARRVPLGASRLSVICEMTFTQLMLEQDSLILLNGVWCQSMVADGVIDSTGYETQTLIDRLAS